MFLLYSLHILSDFHTSICLTVEKKICGLSQTQVISIYTAQLEWFAPSLSDPWREGLHGPHFPHRQAPPGQQDRPDMSPLTVQTPDHMQLGWRDGADGRE